MRDSPSSETGVPGLPMAAPAENPSRGHLSGTGERRSSDRLSWMAVDVVTEAEIKRPRDEVSAFAADPSNATAWYKNIKAVEWDASPPAVVGSRFRFRAHFLGRTLEYTYEVRVL